MFRRNSRNGKVPVEIDRFTILNTGERDVHIEQFSMLALKGERNISCKYILDKVLNKPFILMQGFSKSA